MARERSEGGSFAGRGTGVVNAPKNAPWTLEGESIGNILDLLNGGGGSAGGGGGGGGMVSNAAARAALQGSYNQAEADRQKVYNEVNGIVRAREPGIRQGYDQATEQLQGNIRQRAIADREAGQVRDQQAAQAAAAYGLSVVPDSNSRANAVTEENIGANQQIGNAWEGFNNSTEQRAVERNNAVGDAFIWQGDQQRQALANMLFSAMSGLSDYYVGGSGGGGGRTGLTANQTLGGWENLLGYSDKDFDNELNAAKFASSQRGSYGLTGRGRIPG